MTLQPLHHIHQEPVILKRALLSVYDKTGIIPLANTLQEMGVELLSTGGTAETLRKAGLTVTDVAEVTGETEFLDGRVKTLHPSIHGAILARLEHAPDLESLQERKITPIGLVVANLYPFGEAVQDPPQDQENVSGHLAKATEFIDIGGPAMIRAAAKNMGHVTVLTSPGQYEYFLEALSNTGRIPFEVRLELAKTAFQKVSEYDAGIVTYLSRLPGNSQAESYPRSLSLRYGENPHQEATVHMDSNSSVNSSMKSSIEQRHGKPLSYNNYLDMDAGLRMMRDFKSEKPTIAILKHTVPCGLAEGNTALDAWQKAFETDPVSPFGGVICSTHEVTPELATEIDTIFSEIVLAPSFHPQALEQLMEKKNRRLVLFHPDAPRRSSEIRSFFDGTLEQTSDVRPLTESDLNIVTHRSPTASEMSDLKFAWKAVRYVKSNAILFCKNRQILAIGGGQTSRIDSFDVAIRKAERTGVSLQGSVVASDAFFPFADAIKAMQNAGASAVIQPGGSLRDDEVIEAADNANIAMVQTGFRIFRH